MTKDFVVGPSKIDVGLRVIACLFFALCGCWLAELFGSVPNIDSRAPANTMVVGWIAIAYCGLLTARWTLRILRTGEQLRIGPDGIRLPEWSTKTIPWSEVSVVSVRHLYWHRCFTLRLRDRSRFPPEGWGAPFAYMNRFFLAGDVYFSMVGKGGSFDEAMAAITYFRGLKPHKAD